MNHACCRECLSDVSECCRVSLKESGWQDSYLFALSFFLTVDSGSHWSQFNAAGLVGKVGQEEVLAKLAWELLTLSLSVELSLGLAFSYCSVFFFFYLPLCSTRPQLKGVHTGTLWHRWMLLFFLQIKYSIWYCTCYLLWTSQTP